MAFDKTIMMRHTQIKACRDGTIFASLLSPVCFNCFAIFGNRKYLQSLEDFRESGSMLLCIETTNKNDKWLVILVIYLCSLFNKLSYATFLSFIESFFEIGPLHYFTE